MPLRQTRCAAHKASLVSRAVGPEAHAMANGRADTVRSCPLHKPRAGGSFRRAPPLGMSRGVRASLVPVPVALAVVVRGQDRAHRWCRCSDDRTRRSQCFRPSRNADSGFRHTRSNTAPNGLARTHRCIWQRPSSRGGFPFLHRSSRAALASIPQSGTAAFGRAT